MIEEINDLPNNDGDNNLLNILDEASILYEPPKTKEPFLANIISIILHPLLMCAYGVSLLFLYSDFNLLFAGQYIRFISPIFILSCIVPASGIYFLRKAGLIKDYELVNKSERYIPFLITIFSYSLLVYYFINAGLYAWFIAILVAPLILIVIAAIVNMYWKISIHMMGIGGLIGSTLSICYNVKGLNPFILFIILFILAGCLAVSRLILNRHTPSQVYAGFLVGFVVSYLCVLVGAYWGLIAFLRIL